ncbi:MAG: DUF2382 domain-containing protein [Thermomicrobiales bacterium]
MSATVNLRDVRPGDDVLGSDGGKVGTVSDVYDRFLVVEKGFFFPTDYYIPLAAVTALDDSGVWLNITKDEALNSNWDIVPDDLTVAGAGYAAADSATYVADDAIVGGPDAVITDDAVVSDGVAASARGAVPGAYEVAADDELRIPVREEELTANVRQTEAGATRIEKRVISEDRVLEVPVTEEQVRVSRRVVDRPLDASDADAFEEIVIEVPLTREQVELQRQGHVVEEVVVSKEAIQHTEEVRGTVRREEVIVDGAVVSDVGTDADVR